MQSEPSPRPRESRSEGPAFWKPQQKPVSTAAPRSAASASTKEKMPMRRGCRLRSRGHPCARRGLGQSPPRGPGAGPREALSPQAFAPWESVSCTCAADTETFNIITSETENKHPVLGGGGGRADGSLGEAGTPGEAGTDRAPSRPSQARGHAALRRCPPPGQGPCPPRPRAGTGTVTPALT